MTKKQKLKQLRKLLEPYKFKCKEGCSDCCGLIPISTVEKKLMKNKRDVPEFDCPYSNEAGCANYKERPIVCRAYGAVDLPHIQCEHGCRPKKKMTAKEYVEIMQYFEKEIQTEEDYKENVAICAKHKAKAYENFIEQLKINPEDTLKKVFDNYSKMSLDFERVRKNWYGEDAPLAED